MDIEERIKKFIRDYITYDVEAAVRSFLCPDFRNVHMMRAKKTGERVLEIERVVEKGNKISIVFFCHFPSVWNAVKSVFQAALEETDMEVYLLALPVKVMRENLDYSHEVFFIIGSKGIPARYGGFETFVEKLTKYRISDKIQYHVAVLSDENSVYEYNGAECFRIKVPEIGPAKAVYYDLAALNYSIRYCRKNPEIREPVFYVLACRIGPFIGKYKKKIERSGGRLYINPDGHEWLRGKWILPIRKYWKLSERYMVKHADLVICDSVHIEKYILESYKKYHPDTKYISYGSETELSRLSDKDVLWQTWLRENGLCPDGYYLVVSRFVPENNFEVMIREFMTSKSSRDFVIITTENPKFLKKLEKKLHFSSDPRIKFVGTVYDDA